MLAATYLPCRPRGKDDKPEARDQENFTDGDSHFMKRAGDGFDAASNAQTAVEESAPSIVAAELTNSASGSPSRPRF